MWEYVLLCGILVYGFHYFHFQAKLHKTSYLIDLIGGIEGRGSTSTESLDTFHTATVNGTQQGHGAGARRMPIADPVGHL